MNELAVAIYRAVANNNEHPASEPLVITDKERTALAAVLPLLRLAPGALARLLAEGAPPEPWMRAPRATRPIG
jgi:hypothetical protein